MESLILSSPQDKIFWIDENTPLETLNNQEFTQSFDKYSIVFQLRDIPINNVFWEIQLTDPEANSRLVITESSTQKVIYESILSDQLRNIISLFQSLKVPCVVRNVSQNDLKLHICFPKSFAPKLAFLTIEIPTDEMQVLSNMKDPFQESEKLKQFVFNKEQKAFIKDLLSCVRTKYRKFSIKSFVFCGVFSALGPLQPDQELKLTSLQRESHLKDLYVICATHENATEYGFPLSDLTIDLTADTDCYLKNFKFVNKFRSFEISVRTQYSQFVGKWIFEHGIFLFPLFCSESEYKFEKSLETSSFWEYYPYKSKTFSLSDEVPFELVDNLYVNFYFSHSAAIDRMKSTWVVMEGKTKCCITHATDAEFQKIRSFRIFSHSSDRNGKLVSLDEITSYDVFDFEIQDQVTFRDVNGEKLGDWYPVSHKVREVEKFLGKTNLLIYPRQPELKDNAFHFVYGSMNTRAILVNPSLGGTKDKGRFFYNEANQRKKFWLSELMLTSCCNATNNIWIVKDTNLLTFKELKTEIPDIKSFRGNLFFVFDSLLVNNRKTFWVYSNINRYKLENGIVYLQSSDSKEFVPCFLLCDATRDFYNEILENRKIRIVPKEQEPKFVTDRSTGKLLHIEFDGTPVTVDEMYQKMTFIYNACDGIYSKIRNLYLVNEPSCYSIQLKDNRYVRILTNEIKTNEDIEALIGEKLKKPLPNFDSIKFTDGTHFDLGWSVVNGKEREAQNQETEDALEFGKTFQGIDVNDCVIVTTGNLWKITKLLVIQPETKQIVHECFIHQYTEQEISSKRPDYETQLTVLKLLKPKEIVELSHSNSIILVSSQNKIYTFPANVIPIEHIRYLFPALNNF